MRFSVFNGTEPHEMTVVSHVLDLELDKTAQVICRVSWSPFLFKVDPEKGVACRNKALFEATDLLVFDIDEGLSLEEAIQICKEDTVIIATTKSHQVEKRSGKTVKAPCDRYRVVKVLERPIADEKEYRATWLYESKKLGFVDEQCKDTARFYFPCREIIYKNIGKPTPVVSVVVEEKENPDKPKKTLPPPNGANTEQTKSHSHGQLFQSTLKFIQCGASTGWHTEFLKAAMDLKEQGFSFDEAFGLLTRATKNYYGYLDDHDLHLLNDVYQWRGGKYSTRPYGGTSSNDKAAPSPFNPPSENELIDAYNLEVNSRRRANGKALTFLDHTFDEHFKLTYGITVIGGKTGHGKSTVCINLIAQILLSENCTKKVLLLSNEETLGETYSKLACLMLGLNWKNDYRDGNDKGKLDLVDAVIPKIATKVTIITSKAGEYDTSDLGDVKRILEHAKNEPEKYALVIIDYLQTISTCKSKPGYKAWEISKELGNYLKKYAQLSEIPVVVFAQLWDKGPDHLDFSSRIQNDKNFGNHGHTLLEVIPDYETQSTKIICHKQRWGTLQYWQIVLDFMGGRLLSRPKA